MKRSFHMMFHMISMMETMETIKFSRLQAFGNRGQWHIRKLPQVHIARDVVAQLYTDASNGPKPWGFHGIYRGFTVDLPWIVIPLGFL